MALPELASIDGLAARLGAPVTGADTARAAAAITDASALVRAEAGATWVDDDTGLLTALPPLIPSVVLAVALRLFRARGIRAENVEGYAVTYEGGATDLSLTPGEVRAVRRAIGRGSAGWVELAGDRLTPFGVPTRTPGTVRDAAGNDLGADLFPLPDPAEQWQ